MRGKPRRLAGLTIAAGLFLCATAAWAHHAFAAEFDSEKPVTFKGVITKMEWVNPHTWLHVSVKNPDGTVSAVGLLMSSPDGDDHTTYFALVNPLLGRWGLHVIP